MGKLIQCKVGYQGNGLGKLRTIIHLFIHKIKTSNRICFVVLLKNNNKSHAFVLKLLNNSL